MANSELLIKQPVGVCGVSEDTKMLAELAAFEYFGGCNVLDVGTGTGYIAILLAKLGARADATDINEKALAVAKENARMNNAYVNFFYSDLFSNVNKKYDIIIFNPPISSAPESVKSIIRKMPFTKFLAPAYMGFSSARRKMLEEFMGLAKNHLNKGGKIVITAPLNELETAAAKEGFKKLKHVKKNQDFIVLGV